MPAIGVKKVVVERTAAPISLNLVVMGSNGSSISSDETFSLKSSSKRNNGYV